MIMKRAQHFKIDADFGYVGKLGCVRFPPAIRKVSGIQRGNRLSVRVRGSHSVVLQKIEVPNWAPTNNLQVRQCSCENAPTGCSGNTDVVTVGWSYIKLEESLATELGFFPDTPIKIVAEPSRITVSIRRNVKDLRGIARVPCPP